MVVNIGTDIVEIARMTDILERQSDSFAKRVLTSVELQRYQASQIKQRTWPSASQRRKLLLRPWERVLGTGLAFRT